MTVAISQLNEKPKLKITWWATIFSGLTVFVILVLILISLAVSIIQPGTETEIEAVGPNIGMVIPAFAIAAVVLSIIALTKGERSWAVFIGLIPPTIVLMIILV